MRKVLSFFVVFFLLGFLYQSTPLFAQTTTNPNFSPNTDAGVPQNTHTLSQSLLYDLLSAASCQIAGVDPATSDHRCLGINPSTGKLSYINTHYGLIGMTSGLIGATFNIPVDSRTYIGYLQHNFGVTKAVAADTTTDNSIGFTGLKPLLNIWASFRNITYLLFVVVFILVGIAIMLRVQIDPRTVMTIENQLPKILVGLILVTFSYAIAGLLIDLMWL